jgi:sugar lactone lactonase YvrE
MIGRLRILTTAAIALMAGISLTTATPASAKAPPTLFPTEFALPTGFLPEGVAIGATPFAYFGSRADGDIYRVNLINGQAGVISQGPGTPSVGMKIDRVNRIFVAGGPAGNGRVVNASTGQILASYTLVAAPTPSFINDVVVTPEAAYFTDSLSAAIYKVPFKYGISLPAQSEVVRIPLSGDYQHVPGVNNANGISATPDGRGLIIVQSSTGFLFRVDPSTGVTIRVDLGNYIVTNGDGLLLDGNTLYAVRNRDNLIAVIKLNNAGTKGTVAKELTDSRFDVPTTVALYGDRLYLPNARFGIASPNTATYSAVSVSRP